jgi:curved DNA-binding protein CbpA
MLLEETATFSLNCHGCQYFSKFNVRKNTKIDLQIGISGNFDVAAQSFPARVAWIRKSRRLGGMYQVGVEFDTPQNVWQIDEAPADWNSFSRFAAKEDSISLLTEVDCLLRFAHGGTLYELLGVQSDATRAELKRRFYHLASRFHPDHHMAHPEWTPRLLILMDSLTVAYKTLSDDELKKQYDSRLVGQLREESSQPAGSALSCLEKSRECLMVKNYIGSILWLRRAIEVEPLSSSYRVMLGHSLAAVPEYRQEAIEQLQKAIELDPSHIPAHFLYAQMLEQMKLPWRARSHYIRVLELDTNHREARERIHRIDTATPRPVSRPSLLGRLTGRR